MNERALNMYEDVRTLYEARGFGGRVGFGSKPALVVIDLARSWLDESSPLGSSRLKTVLDSVVTILGTARKFGHPIFFTTMSYHKTDAAGPLGRKLLHASAGGSLEAGSKLTELDPRLERRPEEPLIIKPRASAFWGTAFDAHLVAAKVDTLIITGCSTSGCVRATAESAHNLNLHPIVVREAVGDRSPTAHECNLTDIDLRYGDVVGMQETLDYLTRVPGS
ncbi:isochorismatase family protein [Mesorhizobium sp.]|uniref:isochorismatase family protein n=1 Tax=Mesorhizobium sp. TaxID=1871066 RepID=UPI000FEA0EE1|nr:isochorismatase family protein [Mesorhizobium sp.]RWI87895.1 MAG: isochorismatase family protein [Mesorhizobium sp.]